MNAGQKHRKTSAACAGYIVKWCRSIGHERAASRTELSVALSSIELLADAGGAIFVGSLLSCFLTRCQVTLRTYQLTSVTAFVRGLLAGRRSDCAFPKTCYVARLRSILSRAISSDRTCCSSACCSSRFATNLSVDGGFLDPGSQQLIYYREL